MTICMTKNNIGLASQLEISKTRTKPNIFLKAEGFSHVLLKFEENAKIRAL